LIAQKKPAKMNPAQILNDMILDSLGEQAKDYKFHYTGHSLGAAMAEMQAVDMDIKLQQKGLNKPGEKDYNGLKKSDSRMSSFVSQMI
jgi:hypothetical protein